MKKITEQERAFIEGIYRSQIYIGNMFGWCAKEHYETIGNFLSKTLPERKLGEHVLSKVLYAVKDDISKKKMNAIRSKLYENRIDTGYFEDEIIRTGIKLWFERHMIVQVKRPETFGNKGDYVGDDEMNMQFAANPLFIKFENTNEYDIYIESLDNRDTYARWYKKNIRSIECFPI